MSSSVGEYYRCAYESDGQVLEFEALPSPKPGSAQLLESNIWLVGTWGCRTCVGLYVRIRPDQCLMVHINALVKALGRPKQKASGESLRTPAEGQVVYERVLRKLQKTASDMEWTVTGCESITMCCPLPEAASLQLYTGHYIIKAIREFLKRPGLVRNNWEGFVVNQYDGKVRIVARCSAARYEMEGPMPQPPAFNGYIPVYTADNEEWLFDP